MAFHFIDVLVAIFCFGVATEGKLHFAGYLAWRTLWVYVAEQLALVSFRTCLFTQMLATDATRILRAEHFLRMST